MWSCHVSFEGLVMSIGFSVARLAAGVAEMGYDVPGWEEILTIRRGALDVNFEVLRWCEQRQGLACVGYLTPGHLSEIIAFHEYRHEERDK